MIIGPLAPAVQRFHRRFRAQAPGVGVGAGIALPLRRHGLLWAVHRHTLRALADSLFDGHRVCPWCPQRHWTFITKLKGNRTFADAPGTRILA
jgi:hypothetical protein